MNDIKISTINNPIAFFKYLLFYGGINELLQQFKYDAEVLEANYDNTRLCFWYYEVNNEGEYDKVVEWFGDRLRRRLREEVRNSKLLLDNKLMPSIEEQVDKQVVLNVLDSLKNLHLKCINDRTIIYSQPIQNALISLIRHLKESYEHLNIIHKAYRLLHKESSFRFSFFGAVKENLTFYKFLHELFFDNDIIPENFEDEDDFLEVLKSRVPEQTGIKVELTVKQFEIAFILRALEPFFKHFSYKTIEDSKTFCNKKGEPLLEHRLSSALSESVKKQRQLSPMVQLVIEEIEKKKSSFRTFN